MLENRVSALEADMKDVKSSLSRLEVSISKIDGTLGQMPKATDFANLRADIAEVKGRLSNTPTFLQTLTMTISTWVAGAAIVFAVFKFGVK
jgi:hypothetical protein